MRRIASGSSLKDTTPSMYPPSSIVGGTPYCTASSTSEPTPRWSTVGSVALPCFSRASVASCATQLTARRKSATSPTASGASRWTNGFGAFGSSGYRRCEQFTPAWPGGQRRVEEGEETGPDSASGPRGSASVPVRDATSNAASAARYTSRGIVRSRRAPGALPAAREHVGVVVAGLAKRVRESPRGVPSFTLVSSQKFVREPRGKVGRWGVPSFGAPPSSSPWRLASTFSSTPPGRRATDSE